MRRIRDMLCQLAHPAPLWFNAGMYVVRVVPLTPLPTSAPQVLDYFWTTALEPGALVSVMLGRRSVRAVVLECADVARAKMALRDASFQLKKLSAVLCQIPQLTPQQIALAHWLAAQYATGLATALHAVAPAFLGTRGNLLPNGSPDEPLSVAVVPRLLITQPDAALAQMRAVLRERTGQVAVVVPEQQMADALAALLGDAYAVTVVHSGKTTRMLRTAHAGVIEDTRRIVVGTRSALHLPWQSLEHIILEDPMHEAYKSDAAPRLNAADEARQLATLHGAALTYLSPCQSITHRYLASHGALTVRDLKPHWPHIILTTTSNEVLDGNRSLLSRAAQDALWDAYQRAAPTLIYSARKAYRSLAACTTCRASVRCDTCDIPLRYHRTSEDMLVCYHCAAYRQVPRRCPACTRGVIAPAGLVGSQKIAEAVRRFFDAAGVPALDVPVLDADLATDAAHRADVWRQFDAAPWPVVVASQMALAQRYERTLDTVVIPQADALISAADFRTEERLVRQLEMLADFGPARMVIQTWEPSPLWDAAAHRAWDAWAVDELSARKTLRWPPFCRILKLAYRHRDRGAATRAAAAAADKLTRAIKLERLTATELFGPTPALVEHAAGWWTHHIIIKTNLAGAALSRITRYVPHGWAIDADPRSIT